MRAHPVSLESEQLDGLDRNSQEAKVRDESIDIRVFPLAFRLAVDRSANVRQRVLAVLRMMTGGRPIVLIVGH